MCQFNSEVLYVYTCMQHSSGTERECCFQHRTHLRRSGEGMLVLVAHYSECMFTVSHYTRDATALGVLIPYIDPLGKVFACYTDTGD